MGDVFSFIEFLVWIFQTLFFVFGIFVGIILTLAITPYAFRLQRRVVLRRDWKNDKPSRVEEGLVPEWQNYDPEFPGIAKKCVCHGRTVHPGERVLTWPETGPMNLLHVAVYCESVKEKLWSGR